MKPLSVYIHWPFCASKCPYCDFNSRAVPQGLEEKEWISAYLGELAFYGRLLPQREVRTIYFGGGTPSLLSAASVAAVLQKIAALWPVAPDCEITIEANPASSESAKFHDFKSAGINRLSLGVQALNDEALCFLGRAHDVNAARQALDFAARTFDRYSFDLIYARRGQTPAAWADELQHALSFGAQHMSLYQLTIEEGTAFHKRAAQNESLTATEDDAAAMYELTNQMMAEAGLPPYEISNYAAAGQESRHNLTYWHYEDYIGIGAGAHGRFVLPDGGRVGTANSRAPTQWLARVTAQQNGCETQEKLDEATAMREALMMGLRLTKGIDVAAWEDKFGTGSLLALIDQEKERQLRAEGLLAADNQGHFLRLTREGLQRLNAVLAYLVA